MLENPTEIRFDEQTIPDATPDVLTPKLWRRFRTVLSPADDMEFLEKMKLAASDEDGVTRPTVGGVLMASETPESFIARERLSGRRPVYRLIDDAELKRPSSPQSRPTTMPRKHNRA